MSPTSAACFCIGPVHELLAQPVGKAQQHCSSNGQLEHAKDERHINDRAA